MNVLKLKAAMVEHGTSTEKLAEAIGIHPATMYRKMATEGQSFTIGEAKAIAKELHLTTEESCKIFFA